MYTEELNIQCQGFVKSENKKNLTHHGKIIPVTLTINSDDKIITRGAIKNLKYLGSFSF